MLDIEKLRRFALSEGFRALPCKSCTPGSSAGCPDCGETGRLWRCGATILNDRGLERLRALHAALRDLAWPPKFHSRFGN